MKASELPILADENIHSQVIRALAQRGRDIRSVLDEGLGGASDHSVLGWANAQGRVVLTHDSDFGALSVRQGTVRTGIVYLRPGHISSEIVLSMWDALEQAPFELEPPFLVVVERRAGRIRLRYRNLPATD